MEIISFPCSHDGCFVHICSAISSCFVPLFHFLDILNFLVGATFPDKFLKTYGTSEQKEFFPYEWFDGIDKFRQTGLPKFKLTDFNGDSLLNGRVERHKDLLQKDVGFLHGGSN